MRAPINLPDGHGRIFCRGAIAGLGLRLTQLTLEIVEDAEVDLLRLQRCMDSYRRFGFKLALDDFWRVELSLPRVVAGAGRGQAARTPAASRLVDPAAPRRLAAAVNIPHAAGCQVIAGEG